MINGKKVNKIIQDLKNTRARWQNWLFLVTYSFNIQKLWIMNNSHHSKVKESVGWNWPRRQFFRVKPETTLLYHAAVVNGVCSTNYSDSWWRATLHLGRPEKFYRIELCGALSLSDGEFSYLSWESDHALHLRWEVARTQRSGTGNGAESALHHPRSSFSSEAHPNRSASSQLESSSLNTKPDWGYPGNQVPLHNTAGLPPAEPKFQLGSRFRSDSA